ncbi:chemokine-like receptor 1 [Arapaima gigas]
MYRVLGPTLEFTTSAKHPPGIRPSFTSPVIQALAAAGTSVPGATLQFAETRATQSSSDALPCTEERQVCRDMFFTKKQNPCERFRARSAILSLGFKRSTSEFKRSFSLQSYLSPSTAVMESDQTTTAVFLDNGMNSTSNLPGAEDEYYDYYEDEHPEIRQTLNIMSLVVYSLAFVLGVLGNGVVIWVTGFKMKKTVNTVWFLNLAVADFLFTAFLPLSIVYTAMDFHWPFGKFMCKFNSTLGFLNMFASVYILVVISVDRCVSVVHPVWAQNHRSPQKASGISVLIWLFALILSAPYFAFRDTAPASQNENVTNCFNNFALSDDYETPSINELRVFRHQAMIITRFLFGFVIPFTVIVSCYAIIIHKLRKNRSLAGRSGRPFKIIAAIIIAFFLCWAPYHILVIIEMINHMIAEEKNVLDFVAIIGIPIASSLAFLNSCLNPLLYVFMGQDFKDKVRKSILTVLESAFTEEVCPSNSYSYSGFNSRSKEKSFSDIEV